MATIPKTMADFPPNPEDGELWLPSFIIHEITPPQNAAVLPPHHNTNPPAFTSSFEICFGSFGAKPVLTAVNNNPAPAPVIAFHNPITPITTVQDQCTALAEKYGGTGVFLPSSVNIGGAAANKTEETSRGTGVFLNHQASVTVSGQQKKQSGKKEKTCCAIKESKLRKREHSQHPSDICLPNDWTY